jgi:hypothetical protein
MNVRREIWYRYRLFRGVMMASFIKLPRRKRAAHR